MTQSGMAVYQSAAHEQQVPDQDLQHGLLCLSCQLPMNTGLAVSQALQA